MLLNKLSVDTESLFKLSCGLSNIFLIATARCNYIYIYIYIYIRLEVSQLKFDFKINGWCGSLNLKSSPICNKITTKATFSIFCCFESWFICWKVSRTKSLFKLDGCHLQSINLCLANALPKVFKIWSCPYISLTFGKTVELLEWYVVINGERSLLFFNFALLSCSWGIAK